MKKFLRITLLGWVAGVLVLVGVGHAQMVTNDPIHTIVTTTIKFFQEPSFGQLVGGVKKLVQISKFIQNIHRGHLLAQEAVKTLQLINSYGQAMSRDNHIMASEYTLISKDFTAFAKEVEATANEMAEVVQQNKNSSMDDGSRLRGINDATDRLKRLNSQIEGYIGRIKYLSAKRSFSKSDKLATAKLYGAAAQSVAKGGFNYTDVYDQVGPTYRGGSNNEKVGYTAERKMAVEMSIFQQDLFDEFNIRKQLIEATAEAWAAQMVPKLSENGFYAMKVKEGTCPSPPVNVPNDDMILTTSMVFDSSGKSTTTHSTVSYSKKNMENAWKEWEVNIMQVCGPLFSAYEKQVDLERKRMVRGKVKDEIIILNRELALKVDAETKRLKDLYEPETKTDFDPTKY